MGLSFEAVRRLYRLSYKVKPVLVKVLPLSYLRIIREKLIGQYFITDGFTRIAYDGTFPEGINLIGYLKAEMGLGQGARLVANAIAETDTPFCVLNFSEGNPANQTNSEWDHHFVDDALYNTNIIHINAEQMALLPIYFAKETWDHRYNIAIWLWELEDFPEKWISLFHLVDEVWAPSEFIRNAIAKKSPVPVITIPYGIKADVDVRYDRQHFQLPKDSFIFLSMFDSLSSKARKNPEGAIRAFKQAFSEDHHQAALVVKLNNSSADDIQTLKKVIGERPNIILLDKTMSKLEVNSLIKNCDVFVSLHRSEGFGLVIAEAMMMGRPVIATNWSANIDYMDDHNSCLVDYSLVKVEDKYYSSQFQDGTTQHWADPDLEQAAGFMKRLYSDKEFYNSIANAAKEDMAKTLSSKRAGEIITARLRVLGLLK